jgi:hypothetical protein
MITIKQNSSLSESEKKTLQANLSRGAVNEKWGALPVAIWLLSEARGDEKQLVKWIDQGPQAVIELARKYLPTEHKNNFAAVF